MATHTHTTEQKTRAALAASAAVATTTPTSIIDLGHHLAAIKVAHNAHDEASLCAQGRAARDHDQAMALLEDRAKALRGLIATMPAQTLADVAVQIETATLIVEEMEIIGELPKRVAKIGQTVSLMLRGMLPIVAKAADLDITDMAWAPGDSLRVHRLAGVGVVA